MWRLAGSLLSINIFIILGSNTCRLPWKQQFLYWQSTSFKFWLQILGITPFHKYLEVCTWQKAPGHRKNLEHYCTLNFSSPSLHHCKFKFQFLKLCIYNNLLTKEIIFKICGSPDYTGFPSSLLSDGDSRLDSYCFSYHFWRNNRVWNSCGNLFEILGTPVKTCLKITRTHMKTCLKFWQLYLSWVRFSASGDAKRMKSESWFKYSSFCWQQFGGFQL